MFTMAEGDSSSGSLISDSDSVLSGSVYYSTEVSEDSDESSLLLALPMGVGEIRPYLLEPENSTSGSKSGEELEVDDESGEEQLENTNWYVSVYFKAPS